ncbi:MAG: hypothetical protein IIY21_04520 [Clostridiales bacterium]|nr:hypothetical protein [Clostridiales bacterium]MBQ1573849.1 hypothetical protein [Clostridiales bacterium]
MIVCDKKINWVGGSLVVYLTKELHEMGLKKGDIVRVRLGDDDEREA